MYVPHWIPKGYQVYYTSIYIWKFNLTVSTLDLFTDNIFLNVVLPKSTY